MPQAHRLNDANTGGGRVTTIPQSTVFTNNKLQVVVGSQGTGHGDPPHCAFCWFTAQGSDTVYAQNIKTNHKGHKDTCGHPRAAGSPNVYIGDTWTGGGGGNYADQAQADAAAAADPYNPFGEVPLEDPTNPYDGFTNDGDFIPQELESDYRHAAAPDPGGCAQEAASKAGNPEGLQVGVDDETPNYILTLQIPVRCDLTVDTTMRIGDAMRSGPVMWTWDGPDTLHLDKDTGRITGVIKPGRYSVTVSASVGSTLLDAKKYTIFSEKCTTGKAIKFSHPLPGSTCTSKMGMRSLNGGEPKMHSGCDYAYPGGVTKDVLASAPGVVVFAGVKSGYGNVVILGHYDEADGDAVCTTLYAHLETMYVSKGDQVSRQQPLGREGHSGHSFGNHLHFEIRGPNYITSTNPILYKAALRYDPEVYIGGSLGQDDTGDNDPASAASGGSMPRDPGSTTRTTRTTESPTTALRSDEVQVACRDPVTFPAAQDQGKSATMGEMGVTMSRRRADCTPPSTVVTKEVVIQQIRAVLDADSSLDSADKEAILFIAKIESNFDPYAKNPTSSATGLWQMLDRTAAAYGLTSCMSRTDVTQSTIAFIGFYNKELKRYYSQYTNSSGITMNGVTIPLNSHTARYPTLSKRGFIYTLHHDGVGNMTRGIDKGGINYFTSRIGSSA